MTVYLDLVVILNFLVDLMLLLGTDRLCGHPPSWGRCMGAAALGGVYAGACLLPGLEFLGNSLWRLVFLLLMGAIAFGMHLSALRRCCVFVVLTMALGGLALLLGKGGFGSLAAGGLLLGVLCLAGFRRRIGSVTYVPVELCHNGIRLRLTALEDTGNTLRDPITGRPVLIIDAASAGQLVGLSPEQLSQPVKTLASGQYPRLRLIPFSTAASPEQMVLAMRMESVKIGKWKGSSLVAFAPVGLDREGTFQALTGGAV